MRIKAAVTQALPALLFAAALGCGGSGPSGPGTMNVHLVDGPDADYSSILLQVKKLEIHGPSGWETLADFTGTADGVKTVDLLKLTNGVKETLTPPAGVGLPAGHYDQMRMLLGPGNVLYLKSAPTTAIPLTVPSGLQSGVKFPVGFDVAPGTTRDVFIDFDAHRSIFVHAAGHSGKYLMRPVVRAVDALVTGSIAGVLKAKATGAPLVGVSVNAEVIQGGRPVVFRTTTTGADGKYVLDLLPAGATYYVVALPMIGETTPSVYFPQASPAITISEAAPTGTFDANFDLAAANDLGSVAGTITPAVTSTAQSDTVVVLATFGGTKLIVRDVSASVTTTGETYGVASLPRFGTGYSLAVERGTTDANGTTLAWYPDGGAPFLDAAAATPISVTRNLTVPTTP